MSTTSSPADEWDAAVRAACSFTAGPCPLDVTPDNTLLFSQGGYKLVVAELQLLPPAAAAAAERACELLRLEQAFALRRELISLKKVSLNMYKSVVAQERELRQLAAFFRHAEADEDAGCWRHSPRHAALCDALSGCRGLLAVLFDMRAYAKEICCVPRHPMTAARRTAEVSAAAAAAAASGGRQRDGVATASAPRFASSSAKLAGQPGTMRCWRLAVVAAAAPAAPAAGAAVAATECDTNCEGDLFEREVRRALASVGAVVVAGDGGGGGDGWQPAWLAFFRSVLVARGGAKAMLVRHELRCHGEALRRACAALSARAGLLRGKQSVAQARKALLLARRSQLRGGSGGEAEAEAEAGEAERGDSAVGAVDSQAAAQVAAVLWDESLGAAIRARNELLQAACALEVLTDMSYWVSRIVAQGSSCGAGGSAERLFVAGDGDLSNATSMCLPPGFVAARLQREQAAVVAGAKELMMAQLAVRGWPGWLLRGDAAADAAGAAAAAAAAAAGRNKRRDKELVCNVCAKGFGKLWVHRGVCCECEARLRAEGRCPYHPGSCPAAAFCPHSSKCAACDGFACDACRLTRGDGEDVLALVARLRPHAVFLDFDRTLATTRGGGSPLQGQHSVDPDLLSLACAMPEHAHIVTRNSCRDDIRAFLALKGAPPLRVHTVLKHQSKAEVVCDPQLLPPDRVGLFVDDSLQEHLDPAMQACTHVHRVLFVRGR